VWVASACGVVMLALAFYASTKLEAIGLQASEHTLIAAEKPQHGVKRSTAPEEEVSTDSEGLVFRNKTTGATRRITWDRDKNPPAWFPLPAACQPRYYAGHRDGRRREASFDCNIPEAPSTLRSFWTGRLRRAHWTVRDAEWMGTQVMAARSVEGPRELFVTIYPARNGTAQASFRFTEPDK